jgi:hypothetical protein
MQNACIRFITGASKFQHVTPLYCNLNILKIAERRLLAIAVLIWKVITIGTPEYLYEQFQFVSDVSTRTTRSNALMLHMPQHRMEKFHLSFLVQAIKIWNDYELYKYMQFSSTSFRNLMYKKCLGSSA